MKKYKLLLLPVFLFVGAFVFVGCMSNPVVGDREPAESASVCYEKHNPQFAAAAQAFYFYYEQDGHLYTTYKVAKEAGFSEKRALMLAYYTQYPDIDVDYLAVPVAIRNLLWPPGWEWRDDITGGLHSLHGGDSDAIMARREELANILRDTLQDEKLDWMSGMLIHALGDAYAHTKNEYLRPEEKAYGKVFGHACASLFGNSPDKICREDNKDKYLGYLQSLRDVFKSPDTTSREELTKTCEENGMTLFGPNIDWNKVKESDLKGKPTARFVHCMNLTSRQLTVEEVKSVISKIETGIDDK